MNCFTFLPSPLFKAFFVVQQYIACVQDWHFSLFAPCHVHVRRFYYYIGIDSFIPMSTSHRTRPMILGRYYIFCSMVVVCMYIVGIVVITQWLFLGWSVSSVVLRTQHHLFIISSLTLGNGWPFALFTCSLFVAPGITENSNKALDSRYMACIECVLYWEF